jgi:pimeloyl-ACP methyl ester carboxylesterase/DNA-binding CsgD family transcriptional regulator
MVMTMDGRPRRHVARVCGVDQRIAATALQDGTRVAYAMSGHGPFLVCVPGWVSDLAEGWASPGERAFWESLGRGRTVLRFDLPGAGASDRAPVSYSTALVQETLEAVTRAAGAERFDLFGASMGAVVAAGWAAAHPDAVSRLVLYGGWADGASLAPPEVRTHVLALVRDHWGLGSDVLADIFAVDADPYDRASFARYQRAAATAQTAHDLLAFAYSLDARSALADIAVPTLVLHRALDRAVPVEQGRALAERIPGARFEQLEGRSHVPYVGDVDDLSRRIRRFLGLPALRTPVTPTLTVRQNEVAALIAAGCTNREIAVRLTLSERSVESHVERICQRLGFRSRAQIAAWFAGAATGRRIA